MCRGLNEPSSRRCLPHSAEGKAEVRAAEKLEVVGGSLLQALQQRLAELGNAKTQEDSEQVLSRWEMIVADFMKAWDKTKQRVKKTRAALASLRARHYAEKLAAVKNAEKRAIADQAIKDAEAAQLEFEAAEDAHGEASSIEIRTRPMEGFMTPIQVAKWDHQFAVFDLESARDARDQAWAKLRPVDDKLDPKTGMPTRRKLAFLSAERDLESNIRTEAYLRGVAERAPDHSDALADLGAAEAKLKAARQNLDEAKAARHSALSMGRPPAEIAAAA